MIEVKELTRDQAREAMKDWIMASDPDALPKVDDYWQNIREKLHDSDLKIMKLQNDHKNNYAIDVYMGLYLYVLLRQEEFTMRMASNDGLWRYMSLKVVPDLVEKRWGRDAEEHYWRKPSRIWLRSIWWYIHLSWQGDLKSTERLLLEDRFNTDTILNLEERTGRNGTYINVYRRIMYYYSIIPAEVLKDAENELRHKDKNVTLFRTVMKLNTARSISIDPSLYVGGEDGYAKSLFEEVGVKF